ncbi:MAG: DNA-binding protein [Candidatus Moranbacteria bacterium]|nr:DNA-binding protein [Candidatus Moranbacteria bacterium]
MQMIASHENQFVFNLARGEELFETLLSWCRENTVAGATLTGLGAADQLELAYYHLPTQTYERHQINEDVEILSLNGNLGTLKDEKMLHIHGVFGKRDLSVFGGHLFKLRVSGACEIHLTVLPSPLHRVFDKETGLNLLCRV